MTDHHNTTWAHMPRSQPREERWTWLRRRIEAALTVTMIGLAVAVFLAVAISGPDLARKAYQEWELIEASD